MMMLAVAIVVRWMVRRIVLWRFLVRRLFIRWLFVRRLGILVAGISIVIVIAIVCVTGFILSVSRHAAYATQRPAAAVQFVPALIAQ